MRNQKSQLANAELKFSYTHYPQSITVNDLNQAGALLSKIWSEQCECKAQRKYALFLNSKNELIAWKQLSISLDVGYCAKEITGIAIACNASNIIISHNRLSSAEPNDHDKILTRKTFDLCERMALEILDYLIITPTACLSYKHWLGIH